jgi:hypothetical protein
VDGRWFDGIASIGTSLFLKAAAFPSIFALLLGLASRYCRIVKQIRFNYDGVISTRWGYAMAILIVVAFLLFMLAISLGSLMRSCFVRGRHRGMQEAAAELIRGVSSHFEIEGQIPAGVSKALEKLRGSVGHVSHHRQLDLRHAQLWIFGDAIGSACWHKGYRSGKLSMAPREGKILVELSKIELLQLTWLSHLGFQHMMPNYRSFETHRFSGEDDARDGAKAIERLEVFVPLMLGPVDPVALSNNRLTLIENWWSERKFAVV